MFYELGILFRVHDLIQSDSNYRAASWKIFMRICDPRQLASSTLYEGESSETLMDQEKFFCIAVQTFDPQVIAAVKAVFLRSDEQGLMPPEHRFVEGEVTLRFALNLRARIDQDGRFQPWDKTYVRQDQILCHETGWGFGETVRSTCAAT
jgi:hypothetical protein